MMKVLKLFLCLLIMFAIFSTVFALEEQEPIPINATFSYTWESPMMAMTKSYSVMHGLEPEVWHGDIEGTSDAIWRVGTYAQPPVVDVWLISEFSGTLLGEYEGTMTIMLVGHHPAAGSPWTTQWYGEWAVVDGTGDLANVHGQGIWWGPGNGPNADPEHEVDEIALSGMVVFMESPDSP